MVHSTHTQLKDRTGLNITKSHSTEQILDSDRWNCFRMRTISLRLFCVLHAYMVSLCLGVELIEREKNLNVVNIEIVVVNTEKNIRWTSFFYRCLCFSCRPHPLSLSIFISIRYTSFFVYFVTYDLFDFDFSVLRFVVHNLAFSVCCLSDSVRFHLFLCEKDSVDFSTRSLLGASFSLNSVPLSSSSRAACAKFLFFLSWLLIFFCPPNILLIANVFF